MNLAMDTPGTTLQALHRYGRRLEQYAQLMRLDRPIGTWLLLWPVLWALWIAGGGHPSGTVFGVFVLGVFVMRSAGCAVNDFADRDFDPHVKRTRNRPLGARRVSPHEALVLCALLLLVALWLVTRLDWLTIRMALIGAVVALSYPFFKRFFPLPQFYMGVAFSWGVPMAFAAQTGAVPRVGWLMFFTGIIWAATYDTLYAMVDREDDLKIGVKSSAILFADLDRLIIAAMQLATLFGLLLIGRSMRFGHWYYAGVSAAGLLFAWQQWLIRRREPAECFRAFLNNNYVGMSVFVGILLEYSLRS